MVRSIDIANQLVSKWRFFIVLKIIVFHLYLISSSVGDIPGVVSILSSALQSVCVASTASIVNYSLYS